MACIIKLNSLTDLLALPVIEQENDSTTLRYDDGEVRVWLATDGWLNFVNTAYCQDLIDGQWVTCIIYDAESIG